MQFARLRASSSITDNAAALRQLLSGGKGSTDVLLDISGCSNMSSVMDQVKSLYDVAGAANIATQVNVLLRKGDSDSPLTAADLPSAAEGGFKLHRHVAMGGTFDHLHPGHKLLLTTSAFHTAERLRVGITGDELLKNKKFKEMLQPFDVRAETVKGFLQRLRSDVIFDIVELTEPTGGTTTIGDVTAMVCSPETLPAITSINEARARNGFAPVEPISIEFVGGDATTRISSTALREKAAQSPAQ